MPVSPPVDSSELAAALGLPDSRWSRLECVASTGSTNADLAAAARAGDAPVGAILLAEEQTAGRGRLGRTWVSPRGASLALSVLLRPVVDPAGWGWVSLLAGLGVARGLRCLGLAPSLKWPNDVLLSGRKVCGILAELVSTPTGPAVVLGMGLNVSLSAAELPVPTATSLWLQGCLAPKVDVATAILDELAACLAAWEAGEDVGAAYRAACSSLGQEVRVIVSPAPNVVGRAVDVDEAGRLVVETETGALRFAAGDVIHLR